MRAFLTSLRDDAEVPWIESEVIAPDALPQATLPDRAGAADGHVLVEECIAGIDRDESLRGYRPLVVLTGRDLARPGCASLFGYADHARQIAIISTCRLGHPDPVRSKARLEKVIRHEIGHLRGWCHCKQSGCLMHPVRSPEELDERSGEPCARCASRTPLASVLFRRASAAVFLLIAFAGINLAAALLKPSPKAPFSLVESPSSETAAGRLLLFNKTRVQHSESLVDPAGAPEALNRLYRMIDPPTLSVVARGDNEAVVRSQGAELLRIRHEQAMEEASKLAEQLNDLIVAKGSRDSLCAECHLERKPEVLEAANGRKWNIGPF